jgi:hypothetical protein
MASAKALCSKKSTGLRAERELLKTELSQDEQRGVGRAKVGEAYSGRPQPGPVHKGAAEVWQLATRKRMIFRCKPLIRNDRILVSPGRRKSSKVPVIGQGLAKAKGSSLELGRPASRKSSRHDAFTIKISKVLQQPLYPRIPNDAFPGGERS